MRRLKAASSRSLVAGADANLDKIQYVSITEEKSKYFNKSPI